MEFLPSEILLNIFERLDVADANRCSLLHSRFNEIIVKNWPKINRRRGCIEITDDKERDRLIIRRSYAGIPKLSCHVYFDRVEVKSSRKNKFPMFLSQKLGAADPLDLYQGNDEYRNYPKRAYHELIKYSGRTEACSAILEIMQRQVPVDTLYLENIDTDFLDFLVTRIPKYSIRSLIYSNPRSSDVILLAINKIGFDNIRFIHVKLDGMRVSAPFDLMNNLLPQIPFRRIIAEYYPVSFSLIKQFIENWYHSKWELSKSIFRTYGDVDVKKELELMNPQPQEIVTHWDEKMLLIKRNNNDNLFVTFAKILDEEEKKYFITINIEQNYE